MAVADRLRIVVLGGAGFMPVAGVGWQVVQYLEGFRRLGHDVFYLEDTQNWPYDPIADAITDNADRAVAYVSQLTARCGLGNSWAYRDIASGAVYGTSEARLAHALATADVLINLSGFTVLREEHMEVPVRVYLETDPVLPQLEVAAGREFTIEFLAAHTHHFTYGENFGAPDCGVPLGRFEYRSTRPPVIVDWWAGADGDGATKPFTTIANWRETKKDTDWGGEPLTWSKHVMFERFIELPRRVHKPIELALALDDDATRRRLLAHGWGVRPARPLSRSLDFYRAYIRASGGEFTVAKEQNVRLRSGWFSDRTATYLAAGRPAIMQDTGFGCALPVGEGLIPFTTLEEACEAFASIEADYARHARAATEIADAYLRAEHVLDELLDEVAADLPAATRVDTRWAV